MSPKTTSLFFFLIQAPKKSTRTHPRETRSIIQTYFLQRSGTKSMFLHFACIPFFETFWFIFCTFFSFFLFFFPPFARNPRKKEIFCSGKVSANQIHPLFCLFFFLPFEFWLTSLNTNKITVSTKAPRFSPLSLCVCSPDVTFRLKASILLLLCCFCVYSFFFYTSGFSHMFCSLFCPSVAVSTQLFILFFCSFRAF